MKVTQSYLSLCNPLDYTAHGILQARMLEWVAVPFFRGSSQPRDGTRSPTLQADSLPAEPQGKPKNTGVGILRLGLVILNTVHLMILPPPEDLPNPGIEPASPALAHGFFITEPPAKQIDRYEIYMK